MSVEKDNRAKVERFLKACPPSYTTISRTHEGGRKSVSNIPTSMVNIYTRQGWVIEAKVEKEPLPKGVEPAKTETEPVREKRTTRKPRTKKSEG